MAANIKDVIGAPEFSSDLKRKLKVIGVDNLKAVAAWRIGLSDGKGGWVAEVLIPDQEHLTTEAFVSHRNQKVAVVWSEVGRADTAMVPLDLWQKVRSIRHRVETKYGRNSAQANKAKAFYDTVIGFDQAIRDNLWGTFVELNKQLHKIAPPVITEEEPDDSTVVPV